MMTTVRKNLIDILNSQEFERLEPLRHSSVWKNFSKEERELLARLLVLQGAHQLEQGNQQALESFEIASRASSDAPEILYQQAKILSNYRENMRCLTLACQVLARVFQQNSQSFKSCYLHAQVLVDIGLFEGEASYFIEAHQNFERAQALLEKGDHSIHLGNFFWNWGLCLTALGRISGEPLDFSLSIEKYRQAHDLGCQEIKFLIDFGQSLSDLGTLLERSEYFTEALILFNNAVQQNCSNFDGWYHQACCIQSLAEFKNYEKLLEQAEKSFAKASEINADFSLLWLKWGQVEAAIGKLQRNQQKLETSLLKFSKADQLDPAHPQILSSWAETEIYLGALTEKLDFIYSAQAKILKSLQIRADDPNIWYLYGSCLNELGHYFNEEVYYKQAIEKFQYGLSLSHQHPLLCYGLALAHFSLGELTGQQVFFESAVRHCSQVAEFESEGFPQFWNDWGVALLKLGEITQQVSYVEMAIEKFEKALKQPIQNLEESDLDLEWVYNYGIAFDLLGDLKEEPQHFEKAAQILTQVLQLDPHYQLARYHLALALSHLGEAMFDAEPYYKAIEHFQLLLDQDPEDEMVYLDFGMSLVHLGLLIHDVHYPDRSQNLYRQAEAYFTQAAALGNTQAYYQFAGLYSITGHYNQAMHYLERAQFCGTLPGIEDLLHDEWLEQLRYTPSFRQFINGLSSQ